MNTIAGNLTERQEQAMQQLINLLTHGSGIDCDWHITFHNGGTVWAANSFHCMDEWGGYDGWLDFTARFIKKKKAETHTLRGPCEGLTQIAYLPGDYELKVTFGKGRRKYIDGLGDYLHETIAYSLENQTVFNQFGMRSGLTVKTSELDARIKELNERNIQLRKLNTLL